MNTRREIKARESILKQKYTGCPSSMTGTQNHGHVSKVPIGYELVACHLPHSCLCAPFKSVPFPNMQQIAKFCWFSPNSVNRILYIAEPLEKKCLRGIPVVLYAAQREYVLNMMKEYVPVHTDCQWMNKAIMKLLCLVPAIVPLFCLYQRFV